MQNVFKGKQNCVKNLLPWTENKGLEGEGRQDIRHDIQDAGCVVAPSLLQIFSNYAFQEILSLLVSHSKRYFTYLGQRKCPLAGLSGARLIEHEHIAFSIQKRARINKVSALWRFPLEESCL